MSDIALLAGKLVGLGTQCLFGIPGEGCSVELLGELEKRGCTFHIVSHESAGALMAGGFGRARGGPGVALSIKGPGFSNMLAGSAANWLDRHPVVSLSESYGPGSSPYRMHKRMAHGAMVKPVVKAYADNLSPERLDEVWKLSLAEEPGPVHLDISERMQGTSYERTTLAAPLNSVVPQEIPRRIQVAHTPVVIVGALATRRVWRQRLAALQVPVFTTVAAKGAVDERLPHAAGVFTNSGGPFTPEYQLLPMADLIIGLGLRTSEILDVKALAAPVILLDEMEGTGTGLGAAAEACVDEDGVVAALELLTTKDWGVHEVARARIGLAERLVLDRWLPGGAFHRIQQLLPESTLFVLDTGNFAVIGEHVLEARYPLHVTGSTQGRAMGVAIPRGIGIALGRRGTPVVVAAGDGGIRMYPQEVSLAVQERLPLLVLLMADGFFSGIRRSAIGKGLSENMARLRVLDWCSFFAALGCPAQRVGSFAALADALQAWTPDAGPLFLELVFESHAYMAMTEGIR